MSYRDTGLHGGTEIADNRRAKVFRQKLYVSHATMVPQMKNAPAGIWSAGIAVME
jgi:hypothetical protein